VGWNELYLLPAFLMHNDHYEVILFNNFIGKDELLKKDYPELTLGGSIYMKKLK